MRLLRWVSRLLIVGGVALSVSRTWAGGPPAQKLPSALLVFPLIQAGDQDTRIELVNLSGDPQSVQCFYIDGTSCNEIGFMVFLTAYQPMAWLASAGLNDVRIGSAIPPFFGTGELKCGVMPDSSASDLKYHNTIQGRATVFAPSSGQTVSYGAVGFQRLSPGSFTGVFTLDGTTYAQCPAKLHFDVLTDQPASSSQMILVPCSQNLQLQTPTSVNVQFSIYNEFESQFSTSIGVRCFDQRSLGVISGALTRAIAGSDTAHVVVRGVGGPLLGLVVDEVPFQSTVGTAGNEPSFEGGNSATVIFP